MAKPADPLPAGEVDQQTAGDEEETGPDDDAAPVLMIHRLIDFCGIGPFLVQFEKCLTDLVRIPAVGDSVPVVVGRDHPERDLTLADPLIDAEGDETFSGGVGLVFYVKLYNFVLQ